MKNYSISLILTVVLSSCGPTPKEQAIIDYEQIIEGVKTDLSLKIKSLEKTGVLTFKDSSLIYKDIFQSEVDDEILKTEYRIIDYKRGVVGALYKLADASLPGEAKHYKETIAMYKRFIKGDSLRLQKLKNEDYSDIDFNKKYQLLRRYENFPDSILADKYIANYSIKNPLLNGVKQELKKEYWISLNNKVIYSAKKTE